MKTSIIIILTLILYSCQRSNYANDINISKDSIIKKERIIRYKLLPHKPNINHPFSKNKNDDDTFYTYYSFDSLSKGSRLPTLKQFQGYKIIETNLTGDTIKTHVYDTYTLLIETEITISNDSIKFSRKIDNPSGDISTKYTLTSNNIRKVRTEYKIGTPIGGCGWKDEPEWDYITYLDSNNNPIKSTSSFVPTEQSFKYNSKGNIIYYELIELSSGEILDSTTFSYNTNNQLIEEHHGDNFSMVNKIIYEYKNDTLTQSLHYDIDNNLIFSKSTTYDYDNFGNWIKKTESINSIPRFITEREITYY